MPDDQLPLFDPPPDAPPGLDPAAPAPDPARRRGEYLVPLRARVEHCRSCGKDIIWTKTAGKKAIPLSVATARKDGDGRRWCLPHFYDCPQGKDWSKHGASATKEDDA